MENFLVYLVIIGSLMAVADFWAKSILKNNGFKIYFFSLTGRFKNFRQLFNLAKEEDSESKKYKLVLGLKILSYSLFLALGIAVVLLN